MERSTSTAFADDPTDEEIDGFLDAALAGAAASESEPDTTEDADEESEPEDLSEPEEESDAPAAEDDEEGDEEPEETESPEIAQLRRDFEALKTERETERATLVEAMERVQAERQRAQAAATIVELRGKLTDAEWIAFTGQLMDGFKDHQIRQLTEQVQGYQQAEEQAQFQAAEDEAMEAIMGHVVKEFGGRISATHDDYLRSSRDAAEFKARLHRIVSERKGMTEPARQALRQQRAQSGADRSGVRSAGGARPPTKNYDNFNPDRIDEYLADMGL